MIMKFLLAGTALVTLAAGTAMAADLGRPAPAPVYKAPPMAPAFSWTGFYLGGNLGGAWDKSNGSFPDSVFGLNFGNGNSNGVFIGVACQVGANYQVNNFVFFGVEGDFDWASQQQQ